MSDSNNNDDLKKQIERLEQKLILLAKMEKQRSIDLAKSQLDIVNVLRSVIEVRDEETHLHSKRVTAYTLLIGKELQLPNTELTKLQIGGYLHDIGKIGLPDRELLKRMSLTSEEIAKIRSHPAIGARILTGISLLEPIIPIVLHHHEHFDGRGHPHGLKGENIPLGARIVAIADSYDALTSKRSYRAAFSPKDAINEIKRESNTRFDPKIVEATFKIWERGEFVI